VSADVESRDFELGDILSITTGRLVSRRHIDGVYDILNYMTGDSLFTHQLPRASRECEGPLLAQHPDLAAVAVPEWSDMPKERLQEAVYAWLDKTEATYGARRPVQPLADAEHTHIDPLSELGLRGIPPERIITVVHPGESEGTS